MASKGMKDVKCHFCGTSFEVSFRNHGSLYEGEKVYICSDCLMVELECDICHSKFERKRTRHKEGQPILCSQGCSRKHAIKKMQEIDSFGPDAFCLECNRVTKRYKNGTCCSCSAKRARSGDYLDYCHICKKITMHYSSGICIACSKKPKHEECGQCGSLKIVGKECSSCSKSTKIRRQGEQTRGAILYKKLSSKEGIRIIDSYKENTGLIIAPLDYSGIKVFYPSNNGTCIRCGREYLGITANQKSGLCNHCYEFSECRACGTRYIPKGGTFSGNSGRFCCRAHIAYYSHINNLIDISGFKASYGCNHRGFCMSIEDAIDTLITNAQSVMIVLKSLDQKDLSGIINSPVCWQVIRITDSGCSIIYSAQTVRLSNELNHIRNILSGSWSGRANRDLIMSLIEENPDGIHIRISHSFPVTENDEFTQERFAIESLYDCIAEISVGSYTEEEIESARERIKEIGL